MPRFRDELERVPEAQRLTRLRTALGLSRSQLAEEFGVTVAAVSQWESGDRTISGPALRLLETYEEELSLGPPAIRTSAARRALQLTWSTAFGGLLITYLHHVVTQRERWWLNPARRLAMDHLVAQITQLKGLAMKIWQMVAFLDFMIPEEERLRLRALQDEAPAMARTTVNARIFADLGAPVGQCFAAIEHPPLAAASIGQVHRAQLLDGTEVVVKVQHDDAAEGLRRDLAQIERLSAAFAMLLRARWDDLFAAFRDLLLGECDYVAEAEAMSSVAVIFADAPDIWVPRPIAGLCGSRVLTMQAATGRRFEAFCAEASPAERDRAGTALWRFHYTLILAHGRFHTDMHPDNYLFGDGRVAFLDFGRVQRLPRWFVGRWKQLMRSVMDDDHDGVVASLTAILRLEPSEDFNFRHAHDFLRVCYRPYLRPGVHTFTRDDVVDAWRAYAPENPYLKSWRYVPEMVFMNQVAFGLPTLLARLGARVDCYAIMRALVDAPDDSLPENLP